MIDFQSPIRRHILGSLKNFRASLDLSVCTHIAKVETKPTKMGSRLLLPFKGDAAISHIFKETKLHSKGIMKMIKTRSDKGKSDNSVPMQKIG